MELGPVGFQTDSKQTNTKRGSRELHTRKDSPSRKTCHAALHAKSFPIHIRIYQKLLRIFSRWSAGSGLDVPCLRDRACPHPSRPALPAATASGRARLHLGTRQGSLFISVGRHLAGAWEAGIAQRRNKPHGGLRVSASARLLAPVSPRSGNGLDRRLVGVAWPHARRLAGEWGSGLGPRPCDSACGILEAIRRVTQCLPRPPVGIPRHCLRLGDDSSRFRRLAKPRVRTRKQAGPAGSRATGPRTSYAGARCQMRGASTRGELPDTLPQIQTSHRTRPERICEGDPACPS